MTDVNEATYQGREVPLNKPMAGDVKKSKVFVDPDGDGVAKKVNFGDKNMTIKKHIKDRKKSFNARHNCDNPGPKDKPRYWSCKAWEDVMTVKVSELVEKSLGDACWKGYEAIGTKKKDGKEVPNCVPVDEKLNESEVTRHRVGVTLTDPNHPSVTRQKEKIQKTVRVSGADKADAIEAAKRHYKSKGYKVHDAWHIEHLKEEVEELNEAATPLIHLINKYGEVFEYKTMDAAFRKHGLPEGERAEFSKELRSKKKIEKYGFQWQLSPDTGDNSINIGKSLFADPAGKAYAKFLSKKYPTQKSNPVNEELDEAIKLNTQVKIHAPGKAYHGEVGSVGEIRHGLYKGAPKTYTVDYGDRQSIQLDKKNIRKHIDEALKPRVETKQARIHFEGGGYTVVTADNDADAKSKLKGDLKHEKIKKIEYFLRPGKAPVNESGINEMNELELNEGSMDKMSLQQLAQRHKHHHEYDGGSDRSYKALDAIEKHVKKKYGQKAHDKLVGDTDAYAAGGGSGPVKEDVSTSAADKEAVTFTKPDGTRATKWVKRSRKDIVKEAVAEASLFLEEFETQQAAASAMDRHLKKFPSSKLSITRGTSGKYHVMKHTSGGSSRLH